MTDTKANYHICGLDFELVGDAITTRQDDYLMAHLRRAGAIDVIATMKDAEEKSSELLTRILTSGQKSEILAGLLTEPGRKWNRKRADELAETFGDATLKKNQKDRTDKYKAGLGDSDDEDKGSPNTEAAEAALKARLAALKAGLENELKLWKDYAKLEADENKNEFDQGLITLEAYFSRRRQAIEDEAQKEINTLMQERDLAAKEPSKNDAEKIANQQKVADLDAKIAEARVTADGKEKALDTELFDARVKGSKTILEYEEQILEAQGEDVRRGDPQDPRRSGRDHDRAHESGAHSGTGREHGRGTLESDDGEREL